MFVGDVNDICKKYYYVVITNTELDITYNNVSINKENTNDTFLYIACGGHETI